MVSFVCTLIYALIQTAKRQLPAPQYKRIFKGIKLFNTFFQNFSSAKIIQNQTVHSIHQKYLNKGDVVDLLRCFFK